MAGLSPIKGDVIVAGGGPAGIAAAVASARNGADTVLIERYGFLGGMATAGLVNPFMTYFAGKEQIIEGIFQEIIDRLKAKNAYGSPKCPWAFDPEAFKFVADEICLESGVRLALHSFVSGADVENGLITGITVDCKNGPRTGTAKIYVDCTGDADLAALAGAPFEVGRSEDGLTQPMTLNFRMANVDESRMPSRQEMTEFFVKAKEEGRLDCPRENILYFHTTREGEIHFNQTRVVKLNGADAEDLTRAEIEARRQTMQLVQWMVKEVPGFENAYLSATGTQIGVRESRRVMGEYVLTGEDVLEARKFDDVIARGSYSIDIHNPTGAGTIIKHLPPGESYDIPYRCLIPLKIDNLLTGGRPVSSTHEAHSSLRIMPIAAAIGEAAGTAAALCAANNVSPRKLDVRILQKTLLQQGANLGK